MNQILAFLRTHKEHIPTAALLFGFVWDALTLGRQDSIYGNAVILAYLGIAAIGIVILNLEKKGEGAGLTWLQALVQFCFGNLASGLFVLYGQSGTFVGNWPFFLLLGGFAVANEFARSRLARTYLQLGGYFLLLFAYLALAIPVFLGAMGPGIFFMSGIGAVLIFSGYVSLLIIAAPHALSGHVRDIARVVVAITVVFNALYFLNLIPPVPLVLKDIGIYHSLARVGDSYEVSHEPARWYELGKDSDSYFHTVPGGTAYCFSSVYAPVGLSAPIYHRWEYKDAQKGWETSSIVQFPISGGRALGYRGFSEKQNLREGKWRCNVETARGGLIGRSTIVVTFGPKTPSLVTKTF